MTIDATRLNRRTVLAAAPGVLLQPRGARAGEASGALLVQPQEIRSRNGVLEATLTAAPNPVQLGGFSFPGSLYDGAYLPPLLRARQGDVQRVHKARRIDEIRRTPIVRRRTLVYSRNAARTQFMINGRVMSEDRIDQTARLGDTEEWTIVNTDQQYHSFHIHQTAFLVTEINGVAQHQDSLHDTFSIPPATNTGPNTLKATIPFTDPVIVGKFVFHCHAVDHEDKGMMGVIAVTA